ncbi:hypothetical protein M9H77_10496 [Catharanthus roseus]|uniref:Uncharacterized protein n=1 Tax=Catharanthus roseus TaxID=4058 RepID=A0ACC0BBY9_CATRO|nr:hypothetical protein M9H77_10496 [Catharanthus roseus]
MGGGISGLQGSKLDDSKSSAGRLLLLNIDELPESCVALILSYLDPPQICRLACLNTTFRQASLSDFVWESKLPPNYKILANKLFFNDQNSEMITLLSKKEIFHRFCCSNHFDSNTKEVWMDKNGGGQICIAISWKGLKITGIKDRRYWNHILTDESRFQSIAYLKQIWWLEVEGSLDFEFPPGTYSLFFRLQVGRTSRKLGSRRRICNDDEIHGWNLKPVQFELWSSNGHHHATSQYYLNQVVVGSWKLYYVGDFVIDCTHTKGGLCLDCVLIYPSKKIF